MPPLQKFKTLPSNDFVQQLQNYKSSKTLERTHNRLKSDHDQKATTYICIFGEAKRIEKKNFSKFALAVLQAF